MRPSAPRSWVSIRCRVASLRRVGRTLSTSLPIAAEDNLRQVLAFEMDRQTPFKADQVYFDYRLGEREAAARNLQVELIVVPRAPLDADLAKLTAGSLELDGVDCGKDQRTVYAFERTGVAEGSMRR